MRKYLIQWSEQRDLNPRPPVPQLYGYSYISGVLDNFNKVIHRWFSATHRGVCPTFYCSPTAIILAAFIWTAGEMRPQQYVPVPVMPRTLDVCESTEAQSLAVYEAARHIQAMTAIDCTNFDCTAQARDLQRKWKGQNK